MITCPCHVYPLTPNFYIVKLGFKRVYIFFLIFALKHKLWVLVTLRVPTIYVFSKKKKQKKYHNFSSGNNRFYSREKSLNIAWACFRNEEFIEKSRLTQYN